MTGERAFSKVQFGIETTAGTAVAADTVIYCEPQPVRPDRKVTYVPAALGVRSEAARSVVSNYLVRDTLKIGHAYYQVLPWMFSCGLKGSVSPVNGGNGDYTWTFTPSETAANSPQAFTLEVGDDTQAFEAEYCQFEKFKISGTINQDGNDSPVSIEAGLYGRQWSTTTFTNSIALPTTDFINAKLVRFYSDTAWAGVGVTEKTATLRAFDIEILTGLHPKFMGSANRYFTTVGEGMIGAMVNLTFEGNATADAFYDDWIAQTFRVLRFSITGPQIGSGGYHNLTIDIGGTFQEVIPMASVDKGNNLHTAIFRGRYDATGAKKLAVSVLTDVASI